MQNKLTFSEPYKFTPFMSCIPMAWVECSFDNVDFTNRNELKNFLEVYFKNFDFEGGDSIALGRGKFAYSLMIAIYREIAGRLDTQAYTFFNWPEYAAKATALGYKGEQKLMDDMLDVKFIFIFDYVNVTPNQIKYFKQILNYCYVNNIKLFMSTRIEMEDIIKDLDSQMANIFEKKFSMVEIKGDADA